MNKLRKPFTLEECKIQASILLKSLDSTDIKIAEKSARRFQRLPEFSTYSIAEMFVLKKEKKQIKHKHALEVIARENKFNSWADLKVQINFIINGYLNAWFAHYAEAKSHLQSNGGYLLPYKNQFFICNKDYINQLGFDADDPDWKSIGYDWVKPLNITAWRSLWHRGFHNERK